ncbi:uncharacterized protein LOC127787211 [Diospyros lotus]|uniref:uncharacterized protein LOC127787211 n=1 Tax=Diospyros lotus TaxID=55363 RepID=UPI0022526CB0|nr:uncharacterized protein LOC127787211 [Diospyros lotus]
MRFFKRIAGFLGFAKAEGEDDVDADGNGVDPHLTRKGFSVAVQVPVDRPQLGPVLVPCSVGSGGVQGLRWHARRLRIDEDGDVADEFLDEILPLPESLPGQNDQHQSFPKFEVKYNARLATVKKQELADGRVRHRVEFQGRLQWV